MENSELDPGLITAARGAILKECLYPSSMGQLSPGSSHDT